MFDRAINNIRHQLGIHTLTDWQTVKPEWILKLPNVGPVTLDHIRLYLAAKDITLLDDETPEYWNQKLATRVGKTLSYDDLSIQAPFTVIADTREQHPFTFQDIRPDASEIPNDLKLMIKSGEIEKSEVTITVPIRRKSLGNSMGDYSIEGHQGHCNIERKSMEDAQSTILGWDGGRDRFEAELTNLAAMDTAAVVVECSLGMMLATAKQRGKKTAAENRKILHRQVMSWQQQFRIPWFFCDTRALAEVTTYRILHRYWKKYMSTKTGFTNPVLKGIDEL